MPPPERPQHTVEELSNALQAAVLLASLLERMLEDTSFADESVKLVAALRRASDAASDLHRWAKAG